MIEFMILKNDVLTTIFDKEEMWYVSKNGYAMEISDCSLLDC